MKKLIAIAIIIASATTQVNAQNKSFDVNLFQKELIKEMSIQFQGFKLDTTLNHVLRAKTQEEANSPVYVMKKGGNVDIQKKEKEEAKRVVAGYKARLAERNFNDSNFKNLGFVEFAALATKVNGSVRYAIVIDNNFTPGSVVIDPDNLNKALEQMGFQVISE